MGKKKVLLAYIGMVVGGSTTSLLSMLNSWDYDSYDVDLALYDRELPFEQYLPKQVNVLPSRRIFGNSTKDYIFKGLMYFLSTYWIKKIWYSNIYKDKRAGSYSTCEFQVEKNSEGLDEEYDIAIGYLEGWSDQFVASKVKSKKKIMWIHLDFANVQYLNVPLVEKNLKHADTIVCVSDECLKNFKSLFPALSERAVYLPNINSALYLNSRADSIIEDQDYNCICDFEGFKIISVCRLAMYHKGIDRMIWAAADLKKRNVNFKWYILGDGEDRGNIELLIKENNVEDCFLLLGTKMNPYPFIKQADVFCLPSRYEGKPMVITETMMLGTVPVVTEYSSAKEQIENGITGYIVDNKDDTVSTALFELYQTPNKRQFMQDNLFERDYTNTEDMNKILDILQLN